MNEAIRNEFYQHIHFIVRAWVDKPEEAMEALDLVCSTYPQEGAFLKQVGEELQSFDTARPEGSSSLALYNTVEQTVEKREQETGLEADHARFYLSVVAALNNKMYHEFVPRVDRDRSHDLAAKLRKVIAQEKTL